MTPILIKLLPLGLFTVAFSLLMLYTLLANIRVTLPSPKPVTTSTQYQANKYLEENLKDRLDIHP